MAEDLRQFLSFSYLIICFSGKTITFPLFSDLFNMNHAYYEETDIFFLIKAICDQKAVERKKRIK